MNGCWWRFGLENIFCMERAGKISHLCARLNWDGRHFKKVSVISRLRFTDYAFDAFNTVFLPGYDFTWSSRVHSSFVGAFVSSQRGMLQLPSSELSALSSGHSSLSSCCELFVVDYIFNVSMFSLLRGSTTSALRAF